MAGQGDALSEPRAAIRRPIIAPLLRLLHWLPLACLVAISLLWITSYRWALDVGYDPRIARHAAVVWARPWQEVARVDLGTASVTRSLESSGGTLHFIHWLPGVTSPSFGPARSFLGLTFADATWGPGGSGSAVTSGSMSILTISYWLLALPFAIIAVAQLSLRLIRARSLHGCCRVCGYDLRATPDRCPECGRVVVARASRP